MKKLCTLILAFAASVSVFATEGTLLGRFTVNSNGDQVVFAKGTLQYQASTQTWRFADSQVGRCWLR